MEELTDQFIYKMNMVSTDTLQNSLESIPEQHESKIADQMSSSLIDIQTKILTTTNDKKADETNHKKRPYQFIYLLSFVLDKSKLKELLIPYLTDSLLLTLDNAATGIDVEIALFERILKMERSLEAFRLQAKVNEACYIKNFNDIDTLKYRVNDNLQKLIALNKSLSDTTNPYTPHTFMLQVKSAIAGRIDIGLYLWERFNLPTKPLHSNIRYDNLATDLTIYNCLESLDYMIDWTKEEYELIINTHTIVASMHDIFTISLSKIEKYTSVCTEVANLKLLGRASLLKLYNISHVLLVDYTKGWLLAVDKAVVDR